MLPIIPAIRRAAPLPSFFAVGSGSGIARKSPDRLVLAAALSQGKLVGHEVDYIVGLAAPARLPSPLPDIAFGKPTIVSPPMLTAARCALADGAQLRGQRVRCSQSARLLSAGDDYYLVTAIAIIGQHSFPVGF